MFYEIFLSSDKSFNFSIQIIVCECVGGYTINEGPVDDYCKDWYGISGYEWCFLSGKFGAVGCPGATKSTDGDYYWTKSSDICARK